MVHDERFSSAPAAVEKSFTATLFERNTMLKTLKGKIALVAVAGLGFGLISTVPAFAAITAWGAAATLSAANSTVAAGATSHATNDGRLPDALSTTGRQTQRTSR